MVVDVILNGLVHSQDHLVRHYAAESPVVIYARGLPRPTERATVAVMASDSKELTLLKEASAVSVASMPLLIADAHPAAAFAWDEFFGGMIRNRYTCDAYLRAVRQFLAWASREASSIDRITPGLMGKYFDQSPAAFRPRSCA
jgi:hypothetical protein